MHTFSQRHPIFYVYLYFCYFSAAIQIELYFSGMAGSNGLRDALLMSVIWRLAATKLHQAYRRCIGSALWLASLVSLGY
ncbi:MAG: hypothetical protein ACI89Z_000251 [Porticoccus sp.]|jgi:hypothetical protein